ncbi:MAG: hypothetical protein DI537_14465 [Stutzerimonas stutzeri]|nr:MAG: hypothetical protein DI537_14465 [Stutzerimonas stutzeri]
MAEPVLKTRIRSDATDGAWIEAWLRGSWQKVCGTETYGDLDKVEAWVRDACGSNAPAILAEYGEWIAASANPVVVENAARPLSDYERSPFLAARYL